MGKKNEVRYRCLMFVYMIPGYGGRRGPMSSAGGRERYLCKTTEWISFLSVVLLPFLSRL